MVSLWEPPFARALLGTILMALAAGFVLAFSLFGFVTLARHLPALVHDVGHILPRGLMAWQINVLLALMLLLPFFLRLGIGWMLVLWLLLLGPYMELRERLTGAVALLVLALLAVGLPVVTAHLAYPSSRSQDVYEAVRDAGAPPENRGGRAKLCTSRGCPEAGVRRLYSAHSRIR